MAKVEGRKEDSAASKTLPLLVEIGCEEIPARFLEQAEKGLADRLTAALKDLRLFIDAGTPAEIYSTPRRLIAGFRSVLASQPDRVEEITGPPVKVSFDAEGKPTRAAESFAQKNDVRVRDLVQVTTPKGEYLAIRKTTEGQNARELLAETLPEIITDIAFPKSMYWTSKSGPHFARPIRWIVALLGEGKNAQVIPFEIPGVTAGKATFGHRFSGSRPIRVTGFSGFQKDLLEAHVEIDPENRRRGIRAASQALLEHSERLVEDLELETWHVNSTECPSAIAGEFDLKFLDLPREILITVMRDHQKYFAVEDARGNLVPRFIAILNREGDPKGLIRAGHERVLRARFTDAQFFWDSDLKTTLFERFDKGWLAQVTYREELGTYADKVRRMKEIAREICLELEAQSQLRSNETEDVLRAVDLCKCDLTTQMVREFPELQGIVGGLYLTHQRPPDHPEVADAVYDHYRPLNVEDALPRSSVGCVVSLADKLDDVVVGFATGLEPSGSSDRFGLRRAGNGIIKICAERLTGLDLGMVTNRAMGRAAQTISGPQDGSLGPKVDGFLRERMEFYLREVVGLRYDTVRGTLSPLLARLGLKPAEALARARALERIRDGEDFLALAAAAKRTRNILNKSVGGQQIGVDTQLDANGFVEPAERELYEAYAHLAKKLANLGKDGKYEEAFREMAHIRPQVDRFFDKVLVMAEDPLLRANRVRLLIRLNEDVFTSLGDLAEISVEPRQRSDGG